MANPLPLPLLPPGQPLPLLPPGMPAPPPGAPLPEHRTHKNFAAFYGDAGLDPYQDSYARILGRMDPEVNNAISHVFLLEQAVGLGAVPQAYLCGARRNNQVKVFCVHLPSKYVSALDGQPTPWDSQTFAFLGELVQGMVTTIELPAQAFQAVTHARAYTAEYILDHLDQLGDEGLVPPQEDNEEVASIRTRRLMYLPSRYAALMLRTSGYTLRETWQILYQAIVDRDDLQNCATLVKWLRALSTATLLPNNAGVGATPVQTELAVPLADEDLVKHCMQILNQALPELHKPPETLELALTQMAAAVTQNTNDNRLARDEKQLREQAPKLPSDRYKNTLTILLEYLQCPDEVALPILWHQWANCTKRQEFQVLSELLHAYTRSAEAFSPLAPIVQPKLLQDLQNFIFVSESPDDIKTGIQPFVVADGSAEHRQANLELSRTYAHLASGENAFHLADLDLLKSREMASIPLTYFELEKTLGMFGNLLGVVLGNVHPLTSAYRKFWTLLMQTYRLEVQQIIDCRPYVKPAHVLRSVQLICYNWFIVRRGRLTPPAPDFKSILHTLTLSTYILPHLPPALYRLAYPRLPPLPAFDTPSVTGTDASSSSGSVVSGLTAPSGVSLGIPSTLTGGAATQASGQGTQGSTKRTKGTFQANLNPDHTLHRLIDSGVKLRDLIGDTPPPHSRLRRPHLSVLFLHPRVLV
jgi:hypothetical protein